jgi:hypothetical protein
MQTILSGFTVNSPDRTLVRELGHADARQLLDIGLVRAADGSLRLAEDPSQPVGPALPEQAWTAVSAPIRGLYRWLRSLPLRSPNWHPHFFLRE